MKRLLLLLSVLCLSLAAAAQDESFRSFGLDDKDAAAVRAIRRKMDEIRQRRPTVAIVLSGGGAKGAATVGALKYIQDLKLPVDMVVGTSVGGLLGGLFALGYDADYLDTLIHEIDWDMALSDKVDRSYIPYSRLRYKEKYQLSFPFYYRTEDYYDHMAGDAPFASGVDRQLHLGAEKKESESASINLEQNLLGSLPAGFVFGQNVNQIISSRTVSYSDSVDFFQFPIPFACVATDLVSGRAKVWHSGSVNLAMRSTMSIPALFAPVRTEGMVLVDGGMRNNFPVNVAREMGADIIIGVDLSETPRQTDRIQNLGNIIMSSVDLMSNDIFQSNIHSVDIRIHPDLSGYNMFSFSDAAVDSMYVRGYKAACAQEEALHALKERLGGDTLRLHAPPAVDIGSRPVYIDEIEIVGVPEKEADYIRAKMYVKAGSFVNRRTIGESVSAIFGNGAFDYVTYELRGKAEPYKLRLRCKRGPMHQFGLGARIDTQDLVSLLLNVGLNTNALSGHSLDMTARISTNPYLDVLYSYNTPRFSTINARAMVRYTGRDSFFSGNELVGTGNYSISFLLATQELFFSNMRWSDLDVKVGLRNQFQQLKRLLSDEDHSYDLSDESGDFPSFFLDARFESLDNGYFPTTGASAGFRADVVSHLVNPSANGFFTIVSADGLLPLSFGRFTLLPQGYLRFVMGEGVPLLFTNVMGGDMRSRYLEQQFPFVGLTEARLMDPYMLLARLDLRYCFRRNHYLSLMGNVAYDFPDIPSLMEGGFTWGTGVGYSYNTAAGPLKAQVYWSSATRKAGVYLSYGFNF